MPQKYEALTNTEKYFIVILLALYVVLLVIATLTMGHYVPCVFDMAPQAKCDFASYIASLTPFYGIMHALSCAIVLSAYYLNKLSIKSIQFFRLLTIPPLLFLVYYLYHYGDALIQAFKL
jgi:hypothetical protein